MHYMNILDRSRARFYKFCCLFFKKKKWLQASLLFTLPVLMEKTVKRIQSLDIATQNQKTIAFTTRPRLAQTLLESMYSSRNGVVCSAVKIWLYFYIEQCQSRLYYVWVVVLVSEIWYSDCQYGRQPPERSWLAEFAGLCTVKERVVERSTVQCEPVTEGGCSVWQHCAARTPAAFSWSSANCSKLRSTSPYPLGSLFAVLLIDLQIKVKFLKQ